MPGPLPYLSADDLSSLAAVDALERALLGGLDVDADPPRTSLPVGDGELLVMPSSLSAVKLVSIGGDPRIQGVCVVFDPNTLAPVALVDGISLTNVRTAAVSALAVRWLAVPGARRALIFGRGPQGAAHALALRAVAPTLEVVDVVGREGGAAARDAIESYDLICCCTTSREPLFDGARVADEATVVAIGSHEPDAREVDGALAGRATVVVESRATALREAGDVILAVGEGALREDALVELADVVRGDVAVDRAAGPVFFKSTGMAWEDAVVASAVVAGA
ncbi:ornithine cyclodeaminase family protein [Baekduia sp. Peel2402]|uniref:ornithine cyclodeaminase family protein n=1 Tax=Baekduia sp. Peel2402 TaxID=3458296 RepID=UPI00403E4E28